MYARMKFDICSLMSLQRVGRYATALRHVRLGQFTLWWQRRWEYRSFSWRNYGQARISLQPVAEKRKEIPGSYFKVKTYFHFRRKFYVKDDQEGVSETPLWRIVTKHTWWMNWQLLTHLHESTEIVKKSCPRDLGCVKLVRWFYINLGIELLVDPVHNYIVYSLRT